MSYKEIDEPECEECGVYHCKLICENCANKKALELIEEDIKIQKEFLKKQPENKEAIQWRIIGMELLKSELNKNE